MTDQRLGPALVAEALGTFVLVFAGCGAIVVGSLSASGVAAAFGLAIMVSIYALGHVSGAHLNPAVTAAFAVGRHFPPTRVVPYWVAHVTGALVAAAALQLSLGDLSGGITRPAGSELQAFFWEATLTFVSSRSSCRSRPMFGPSAKPRRSRSAARSRSARWSEDQSVARPMNPARSVGPALVGGDLAGLWIYLAAPFLGAILAVLVYGRLRS